MRYLPKARVARLAECHNNKRRVTSNTPAPQVTKPELQVTKPSSAIEYWLNELATRDKATKELYQRQFRQFLDFTGKQKDYNERLLTLLYDDEPLTAWQLTAKIRKTGRQSLHATLNKRLRELEKKGYVQKMQRKWVLRFKGIIAVLIILKKPRPWNPKWTELFTKVVNAAEDSVLPSVKRYGLKRQDLHVAIGKLNLCLDDYDEWVGGTFEQSQRVDGKWSN